MSLDRQNAVQEKELEEAAKPSLQNLSQFSSSNTVKVRVTSKLREV
jgi:hypothetical protein